MARDWKPRPAPRPTTITAIARTYHAAAVALAQSLGISLAEVLAQYPSAVSTVFIECSRCELRLPASVKLPPLTPPTAHGSGEPTDITSDHHDQKSMPDERQDGNALPANMAERPNGHAPPLPTAIPSDGDLPCAGQEIATLKPAALAMLIAKTATLAHAEGAGWAPLLHALESERARRLAQGRRPRAVVPPNPRHNYRYVFGLLSRPYRLIVTPQNCRRCLFYRERLILPLYGPEGSPS